MQRGCVGGKDPQPATEATLTLEPQLSRVVEHVHLTVGDKVAADGGRRGHVPAAKRGGVRVVDHSAAALGEDTERHVED